MLSLSIESVLYYQPRERVLIRMHSNRKICSLCKKHSMFYISQITLNIVTCYECLLITFRYLNKYLPATRVPYVILGVYMFHSTCCSVSLKKINQKRRNLKYYVVVNVTNNTVIFIPTLNFIFLMIVKLSCYFSSHVVIYHVHRT